MAQPPDDSPRGSSPSFDRGLHRDRERRRARGDRVPRRRQRHLHERLGTTPGPGGWHEGNDIMSVRHQPAVAFERRVGARSGRTRRAPSRDVHARPARQERDGLLLHPPEQRPRAGQRQRAGLSQGALRAGTRQPRPRQPRPARRLRRRLRRRERHPAASPLRGAQGRTARRSTRSSYLNDAKHLLFPRLAAGPRRRHAHAEGRQGPEQDRARRSP